MSPNGSPTSVSPPSMSLTPSRMTYVAIIMASVTYGIYLILAGICIHFLLQRRAGVWYREVTLLYTIAMLVVYSIYFVTTTKWTEVVIIETTNPAAFVSELFSPLALWRDTTYSASLWLADSLIVSSPKVMILLASNCVAAVSSICHLG
jgi:hypothetical protein